MKPLLDNIMWNCLSGPHAKFATGSGAVRRYAPGFSAIVGCEDPERPDFTTSNATANLARASISISGAALPHPVGASTKKPECSRWSGTRRRRSTTRRPTPRRCARNSLRRRSSSRILTNPGPFGRRTPELGEYFGYFDDGRLIAMAGERMCAGELHEVSGVCTHPAFQGRGLARKLTLKLVRRQLQRGKTPFLHVMGHNTAARELYRKMGFRDYRETLVRVATRVI
jgi:GNAT superfamily N-acetyltransferase